MTLVALTPEQHQALDAARALVSVGIPIFVAYPDAGETTGFRMPRGWQHLPADPSVVDRWQPGMAMGMVMGYGLDLLDIDNKPGTDTTGLEGIMPTSYGAAVTPSGGMHSFIRSIGSRSRDAVMPGVDVKAGVSGVGHGFAFIAPTVKASKNTGLPEAYRWASLPDVSRLAAVLRGEVPDDTGAGLSALIASLRDAYGPVNQAQEYDGPGFDQLPADRQAAITRWLDGALAGIKGDLEASATWGPEQTDSRGRGWERLQADAAYRLGRLARATWNDLTLDTAESVFLAAAPSDGTWTLDDVTSKWHTQCGRGAAAPLPDLTTAGERDASAWAALGVDTSSLPVIQTAPDGTVSVAPPEYASIGAPLLDSDGVRSRYFDKGGIQAATLAGDVLALGPLRKGRDHRTWSYGAGVWHAEKDAVSDRLTRLLGQLFRTGHVATVEAMVKANVETITCDPVPELVNFRNGLLDWRTGELHPHSPAVPSTVQLGVEYAPQAQCPAFDRYLSEVVPPDVVNTVWELIGYLMFSGNPLHKAVMLTGSGRNGKGTFIRVLQMVLDRENITNVSLYDLVHTRFTTASLFGKLANIAGDIDATYMENTATFKQITGGDTISAEHKGKDRFDFTPWAVPLFSANKIPASADTTVGYLSRWVVVPFPYSFEGREDRTLDDRLHRPEELAGIAARGIAALPGLLERGDFEMTESSAAARDEFIRRVDQVRSWLADCCEIHPDMPWVARTELYQAYTRWAARDGHRAVRASEFYDRLESAGAVPATIQGNRGFKHIRVLDGGFTPTPGFPSTTPSVGVQGAEGAPISNSFQTGQGAEGAGIYNSFQSKIQGADEGAGASAAAVMVAEPTQVIHRQSDIAPVADIGGVDLHPDLHPGKTAGQVPFRAIQGAEGAGALLPPTRARTREGGLGITCTPAPSPSNPVDNALLPLSSFVDNLPMSSFVDNAVVPPAGQPALPSEILGLFGLPENPPDPAPKKPRKPADPAKAEAPKEKRAEVAAAKRLVAVAEAEGGKVPLPALVLRDGTCRTVATEDADALLGTIDEITVDVEHTGYPVGHRHFRLRTVQLGNEVFAFVLDPDASEQADVIRRHLARAAVLHAHSAQADLVPLALAGMADYDDVWSKMFDTAIAAQLADPSTTKDNYDLKGLAKAVLGDGAVAPVADAARSVLFKAGAWLTEIKDPATEIERSGWAQVDPASTTMVRYAGSDVLDGAAVASRLPWPHADLLDRERLAQRMVARVSYDGIRIDPEPIARLLPQQEAALADAGGRLQGFGIEKPGSDKEVATVAENLLNQIGERLPRTPPSKTHPAGQPSVAEGAIEPYANHDGPLGEFVRARLDYQKAKTALGLFLRPYATLVEEGDGRARPTIYTLSADTGRMSASRPNVQQLPREGGFRSMLTADPGELLIAADFAGVELRVAAALSQDPNLLQMLANGVDLHWEIARQVWGPAATKAHRYKVKPMVFGRLYGSGAAGMARQNAVSQQVAQAVIDTLDNLTPGLTAWSRQTRDEIDAGQTQFQTYSGRVVHLPKNRSFAGPNYKIQGTARELLIDALVRWSQTRWGTSVLFPVHDEIVVKVPEHEAEEATTALVGCMTTELYGVAIDVESDAPTLEWRDAA